MADEETPARVNDGTSARVRRNRTVGVAVALFVFGMDQLTKWIVLEPLNILAQPDRTIEVVDFFDLRFVPNYGVSMGYLPADSDFARWLLVGLTAAIAIFVAAWMWREKRRDDTIGLALILGGAVGNILDRVRLGHVVDFADLHFGTVRPFLVFNVADAAITIGVLLLIVRALLMRDGKRSKKEV